MSQEESPKSLKREREEVVITDTEDERPVLKRQHAFRSKFVVDEAECSDDSGSSEPEEEAEEEEESFADEDCLVPVRLSEERLDLCNAVEELSEYIVQLTKQVARMERKLDMLMETKKK